jgi:ABC-type uncharacterized transport system substrate-binding protein
MALCVFFAPPVLAQENILLVLSENKPVYHNFNTGFEYSLNSNINKSIIYADELTEESFKNHDLAIIVGTKSASKLINYKLDIPLIYALITREFYELTLQGNSCPGKACYAVYIQQPVERYIQLAALLFDTNRTIAIPLSSNSKYNFYRLSLKAKAIGLRSKRIILNPGDNIPRLLSRNIDNNDVLLALPDPEIYNKNTARSIILTTYHNNVPIIGYSQAFSKAGALISLYSSVDNISAQTITLIHRIFSNKKPLQRGYYPEQFSIESNEAVARSLGIRIPDSQTIMKAIK